MVQQRCDAFAKAHHGTIKVKICEEQKQAYVSIGLSFLHLKQEIKICVPIRFWAEE